MEETGGCQPAGSRFGIWPISTPAGPGFDFIVTDQAVTPWNPKDKAILALKTLTSPIGKAQNWTFNLYLPKQSLIQQWHAGVLWEFHTEFVQRTSPCVGSGRHLSYRPPDGLRRESYTTTSGGPVPWDRWVPVAYDVKWSLGSDGYLRVSIDGTQYLDYSGPTASQTTAILICSSVFIRDSSRPDKRGAFLGYSSAGVLTQCEALVSPIALLSPLWLPASPGSRSRAPAVPVPLERGLKPHVGRRRVRTP